MDLNNKNNLLMKLFWLRVVKFDDIEVVLNKKVNSGFISALDIYISYLYMAYRRYFIAPQCILSGVIWVKDWGLIEFDKGRFLQTKKSLPEVKQAISELNALIEIQSKQH